MLAGLKETIQLTKTAEKLQILIVHVIDRAMAGRLERGLRFGRAVLDQEPLDFDTYSTGS